MTDTLMRGDLTPVREFKRRAEQALPGRLKKVMLYGSRARGKARRASDWDVAVFIKGAVSAAEATTLSHIGSDLFFVLPVATIPEKTQKALPITPTTPCTMRRLQSFSIAKADIPRRTARSSVSSVCW